MTIEEMIIVLRKAASSRGQPPKEIPDDEFYDILRDAGLMHIELMPGTLPWYDYEAVDFAIRCLEMIQ